MSWVCGNGHVFESKAVPTHCLADADGDGPCLDSTHLWETSSEAEVRSVLSGLIAKLQDANMRNQRTIELRTAQRDKARTDLLALRRRIEAAEMQAREHAADMERLRDDSLQAAPRLAVRRWPETAVPISTLECAETDYDRRGDCDGEVRVYVVVVGGVVPDGHWGQVANEGSTVTLCASHAQFHGSSIRRVMA